MNRQRQKQPEKERAERRLLAKHGISVLLFLVALGCYYFHDPELTWAGVIVRAVVAVGCLIGAAVLWAE